MRIVKEATERKNEILDAAAVLFMKKGFDNTSTNDILDAVGIARGTLIIIQVQGGGDGCAH